MVILTLMQGQISIGIAKEMEFCVNKNETHICLYSNTSEIANKEYFCSLSEDTVSILALQRYYFPLYVVFSLNLTYSTP